MKVLIVCQTVVNGMNPVGKMMKLKTAIVILKRIIFRSIMNEIDQFIFAIRMYRNFGECWTREKKKEKKRYTDKTEHCQKPITDTRI